MIKEKKPRDRWVNGASWSSNYLQVIYLNVNGTVPYPEDFLYTRLSALVYGVR